MKRMVKGDDIRYCDDNVANVWERNGYTEAKENKKDAEKNAIKAELDKMGIEYHRMLGIDKLRALLKENK